MSNTLLFADDSVTMRRVVELTFAEQGLQVVGVSDGQQAIDYISTQRPALALVSATLPRVNGFDVARFVRDHSESRVPVLLLAGAFDNLDEAQVREAGAAGVLVKPFEPAVVIKRVKELLGMKPEGSAGAAPAAPRSPSSSSGRMFTSSEGPTRIPPPAPEAATTTPSPVDITAVSDAFDPLNAAFDSLDAQLAAKSAPAPRALTTPTALDDLAAIDTPHRPTPAQAFTDLASSREQNDQHRTATGTEAASKPVFEVDESWFENKNKPNAGDSLGDLTEFVVTRASDYSTRQSSSTTPEDRSWIPTPATDAPATPHGDSTPGASGASAPPVTQSPASTSIGSIAPAASTAPSAAVTPSAPIAANPPVEANAPVAASAPVPPSVPVAPVATVPSGPANAPSAPDAFAMLWAQEQGRTTAPSPAAAPPPAATELSAQTIDAVTEQLTERVAARVGAPLADRLSENLGDRLTNGIAGRLTGTVADHLTSQLPAPLVAGISGRVTSDIAERVSATVSDNVSQAVAEKVAANVARLGEDIARGVAERLATHLADDLVTRLEPVIVERLTATLGDRLATNLAERVADLVAERTLQSALGDSLRQTVHDVAERVVQAEVDRIKSAARALRASS
jgi:CheY-like chemotaxis protein